METSDRLANNPKVLIIEDDKSLVKYVKHLLESNGYLTDYAYNGASGIAKVKKFKPDIILLDVMMDVMDGFKVAEHLKDEVTTKFIPIIMLTSKADTVDKVRGLNCGIDDYIVKPFETNELLARIASLLSKKKNFEKFAEDEKIKTLKNVVASVNHEINNPLTAIMIAVEALLIKYKDHDYVTDKLKIISNNSTRIKEIISELDRVQKIITKEYYSDVDILNLNNRR